MPGYQKLLDRYGSRGVAVIGFKFDTMPDMEDPILFAKKIGVRYPLAVAADGASIVEAYPVDPSSRRSLDAACPCRTFRAIEL
jgi:hypothetical protein